MNYWPEMGGKPEPRLFQARHNYGSSYSLSWAVSRQAEAEKVMRENRIRPAFKTEPERGEPGEWSAATQLGEPVMHCLVTHSSYSKLSAADVVATECLLD